jgi:hypothetical protein
MAVATGNLLKIWRGMMKILYICTPASAGVSRYASGMFAEGYRHQTKTDL